MHNTPKSRIAFATAILPLVGGCYIPDALNSNPGLIVGWVAGVSAILGNLVAGLPF